MGKNEQGTSESNFFNSSSGGGPIVYSNDKSDGSAIIHLNNTPQNDLEELAKARNTLIIK